MFRRIIFLTVICYSSFVNSQNKVAILDFEDTVEFPNTMVSERP